MPIIHPDRCARPQLLNLVRIVVISLLLSPALVAGAEILRVVTWNVSMGLEEPGLLAERLGRDDDPALLGLASVLQLLRPDVVLLNEFDYAPGIDAAALLNRNYLAQASPVALPLHYAHAHTGPVNTGVDSGLDLDMNGSLHDPEDAWGFGRFPGQYGMLLLSRLPIDHAATRSFQHFRWSDVPGAQRPELEPGVAFFPDETWAQLRLSSKNHWDLPLVLADGRRLHLLVSHPTPPAFDGPEDRNGRRNHDEIRLWADYIRPEGAAYLYDDSGRHGGLDEDALFVIAGDLNADPVDGGSRDGAIRQLLDHPRIQAQCIPVSEGAVRASQAQAGANLAHQGDPAQDTGDFSDGQVGNLRADYLLPSTGLEVVSCGVFWPAPGEPLAGEAGFSDHHAVWLDIRIPELLPAQ